MSVNIYDKTTKTLKTIAGGGSAETVPYDNSSSGLTAADMQSAIDEEAAKLVNIDSEGKIDYSSVKNAPVVTNTYSATSTDPVSGIAVASAISGKADIADTLSDYGITDAKIENGTITLGENTITPMVLSSNGTAGQFATSDGNGGITWITISYAEDGEF